MISQLTLTIVDSATKSPIPDVTISLKSIVTGATVATQKTDVRGITIFSVDEGVWKYTASKGGFSGKEDSVYLSYPAAGHIIEMIMQSTPPDSGNGGYEEVRKIGPSCTALRKDMGGHYFNFLRDDKTGKISSGYYDWSQLDQSGIIQEYKCDLPMPPPPEPGPSESRVKQLIDDAISGLRDLINGILKRLSAAEADIEDIVARAEEEAAAWRAGLNTEIAGLRGALTGALSDALKNVTAVTDTLVFQVSDLFSVQLPRLWTSIEDIVAHAEEEAAAWRDGVKKLDFDIRGWVEKEIVDILMRALDREVPEAKK